MSERPSGDAQTFVMLCHVAAARLSAKKAADWPEHNRQGLEGARLRGPQPTVKSGQGDRAIHLVCKGPAEPWPLHGSLHLMPVPAAQSSRHLPHLADFGYRHQALEGSTRAAAPVGRLLEPPHPFRPSSSCWRCGMVSRLLAHVCWRCGRMQPPPPHLPPPPPPTTAARRHPPLRRRSPAVRSQQP